MNRRNRAPRGETTGGQGHSLQNRVRDVFRKGLQWKWDRSLSREQGPVESASLNQSRWPRISPATIRKFRRLFSTTGADDVSPDGNKDPPQGPGDSGMTEGNTSPYEPGHQDIEKKMINMKSKEKKRPGRGKCSPSSSPLSSPESPISPEKPSDSGLKSEQSSCSSVVSGLIKHFETLNMERSGIQTVSCPGSRTSSRSSSRSARQSLSQPASRTSSRSSSRSSAQHPYCASDKPDCDLLQPRESSRTVYNFASVVGPPVNEPQQQPSSVSEEVNQASTTSFSAPDPPDCELQDESRKALKELSQTRTPFASAQHTADSELQERSEILDLSQMSTSSAILTSTPNVASVQNTTDSELQKKSMEVSGDLGETSTFLPVPAFTPNPPESGSQQQSESTGEPSVNCVDSKTQLVTPVNSVLQNGVCAVKLEEDQELANISDTSKETQDTRKHLLKILGTRKEGSEKSTPGSTSSCQRSAAPPSIIMQFCDAGMAHSSAPSDKGFSRSSHELPCLQLTLDPEANSGTLARKSPVTVQEWVDSIPLASQIEDEPEDTVMEVAESKPDSQERDIAAVPGVTVRSGDKQSSVEAGQRREAFSRDASPSLQSDTGSHASSVDSYLEARRPDPEEVLLGLGFGGSLHAAEAEVSRIPSRFLQPSKVKGIAISDFLKYQQDLIETFESGFCGYRGLTGGSQNPSVIVAKIIEKLREHERESSTKSSAGSTPGYAEITRRRFSRAAQKVTVLTKMRSRDSLGSGGQPTSVLNPDNRKFLDNQGSKSPEISRKRMIIGHRSFTFDCDGHLIEAEPASTEPVMSESSTPPKPPPPRPLLHNDSVLSSATSLSLTSYDSDSDTDEASAGDRSCGGIVNTHRQLQRLQSTPATCNIVQSVSSQQLSSVTGESRIIPNGNDPSMEVVTKSMPSAVETVLRELLSSVQNAQRQEVSSTESQDSPSLQNDRSWRDLQRVNSAPSFSASCALTVPSGKVLSTHQEERPKWKPSIHTIQPVKQDGLNAVNSQEQIQRMHTKQETAVHRGKEHSVMKISQEETQRTPEPSNLAISGEGTRNQETAILSMRDLSLPLHSRVSLVDSTDSVVSPCSLSSDTQYQKYLQSMYSVPPASAMFLDKATLRKLSLNASTDSCVQSPRDGIHDTKGWSSSSVSSWESEAVLSSLSPVSSGRGEACSRNDWNTSRTCEEAASKESEPEIKKTPISSPQSSLSRRSSLKRQQNVKGDGVDGCMCDIGSSKLHPVPEVSLQLNLKVDLSRTGADKVDSFEMEELGVEEEGRVTRTGSAHSATSAYSDSSGFQEEHQQRMGMEVRAPLNKQLSESEPQLCTLSASNEPFQPVDHLKRLSLPVIRIQDEWGHNQWHSSRFYREPDVFTAPVRRVKSLPCRLFRVGFGRFSEFGSPGSVCDSISNMFSSCSDDSVIHIPTQSDDVSMNTDHISASTLAAALSDLAGEPNARCATQHCSECNKSIKDTFQKCRDELGANSELWSQLTCEVKSLRAAQDRVSAAVNLVQESAGASSDCSASAAVLKQVVEVVQHQSVLCNQLESLTSELPQASSHPANSVTNLLRDSLNSCRHMPVSCQPIHSSETYKSVCQVVREEDNLLQGLLLQNGVIREENHRLEGLVRQNAEELAQIRCLLETVLKK